MIASYIWTPHSTSMRSSGWSTRACNLKVPIDLTCHLQSGHLSLTGLHVHMTVRHSNVRSDSPSKLGTPAQFPRRKFTRFDCLTATAGECQPIRCCNWYGRRWKCLVQGYFSGIKVHYPKRCRARDQQIVLNCRCKTCDFIGIKADQSCVPSVFLVAAKDVPRTLSYPERTTDSL